MRDAPLSYTERPGRREGTTVLELRGPLTLGNMFQLQDKFRGMASPVLIVDMTGVAYMDSAGMGLLVNGYTSAQRHGRTYLLAGVTDRVRALFELTRVDSVLKMFPSVNEAEDSLG